MAPIPSTTNPWAEPLPLALDDMRTFIVIAHDLQPSSRLAIRPQHVSDSAVGFELGWIINGGPTFGPGPPTDPPTMTGSWMFCRGTSEEAVKERLARDIYAREGAWDMSKVEIRACSGKV